MPKGKKAKPRQRCPINIAWLRLQLGTLRVDLDTCEVFRLVGETWKPLIFHESKPFQGHCGGYWFAKIRISISGVGYRQNVALHRLIYMAKYNVELKPEDQVDHGKQGKSVNHWSNLEKVDQQENNRRRDERDQIGEYSPNYVPF